MGRTETASSLELVRSMNQLSRSLTYEEHLKYMESIDKLDDERRNELRGLIIWNESMQTNFLKRIQNVIDLSFFKDESTFDSIKKIISEMSNFNKGLNKKIKENFIKEDFFEQKDDETRRFLITYSERCRERLGDENREIEEKMMLENAMKLISKK